MRTIEFEQIRCLLHVPTYRTNDLCMRYYQKKAKEVDAVVFDFEDSVPKSQKKEVILKTSFFVDKFAEVNSHIFFRLDRDHLDLQIAEINKKNEIKGIIWPKFSAEEELCRLRKQLRGDIKIIPVIETADAVLRLEFLLSKRHDLAGLIFGPQDLSAQLGVFPTWRNLLFAASKVKLVATTLGLPVWGVVGEFAKLDSIGLSIFKESLQLSKEIGFSGCFAIHPRQIKIIKNIFSLNQDELKFLKDVEKLKGEDGVQVYDHFMHGPPSVIRKKNINRIDN